MANIQSIDWLCGLPCTTKRTCQRPTRLVRVCDGVARKLKGDVKCQGIRLPGLLSSPTPVLPPSQVGYFQGFGLDVAVV